MVPPVRGHRTVGAGARAECGGWPAPRKRHGPREIGGGFAATPGAQRVIRTTPAAALETVLPIARIRVLRLVAAVLDTETAPMKSVGSAPKAKPIPMATTHDAAMSCQISDIITVAQR
ncbi:hypothetical protein ACIA6D_40805 [Streptomyces cacaoi]|uniref:hypothetical protein n=1 Tax=Streptomyces cacaoi TaxID=1898 RepID=UPI0037494236